MALSRARTRRPLGPLARVTLGALIVNALAYAIELPMLGQLDREVSIVVACLLGASGLVTTGWRWAPLAGGLLAGAILVGNPWLWFHLTNPNAAGFLLAAVMQVLSGVTAVVAGIAASALPTWRSGVAAETASR